jgi:TDG/mug DNA glycosylase family protein
MDRETVLIYEARAGEWAERRKSLALKETADFEAAVPPGATRVDLGCGPGRYTDKIGAPVVALDAASAMLRLARDAAPDALCIQADLEALPFRPQSLGGGWAMASYLHVPRSRLPLALAQLHRSLTPGAPLAIAMQRGDYSGHDLPNDTFTGRFFAGWQPEPLVAVIEGAGFEVQRHSVDDPGDWILVEALRMRTLPDFVGPGMRILMCGLNPSLRSADMGVGFAGPSNRFWPAAIDAGIATRPRDPWDAYRNHAMGMTDLVKRATVGASELKAAEYREGAQRVIRIAEWLEPGVVCFVGLAGYRAAIDKRAQPGLQPEPFGGRPAYVMPSTSGLNARTSRAELTDHLQAALKHSQT